MFCKSFVVVDMSPTSGMGSQRRGRIGALGPEVAGEGLAELSVLVLQFGLARSQGVELLVEGVGGRLLGGRCGRSCGAGVGLAEMVDGASQIVLAVEPRTRDPSGASDRADGNGAAERSRRRMASTARRRASW